MCFFHSLCLLGRLPKGRKVVYCLTSIVCLTCIIRFLAKPVPSNLYKRLINFVFSYFVFSYFLYKRVFQLHWTRFDGCCFQHKLPSFIFEPTGFFQFGRVQNICLKLKKREKMSRVIHNWRHPNSWIFDTFPVPLLVTLVID